MNQADKPYCSFRNSGSGSRLDHEMSRAVAGLSRRRARELCRQGMVRVNGKTAAPGLILRQGDVVEYSLPAPIDRSELAREGRPLCICYEDEFLIAVEKPRRMHSVVQRDDDPYTLADSLAGYLPQLADVSADYREAGLVQRLDFFTSGLVLAAKSTAIWQRLYQMLLDRRIQKSYLALVKGDPFESRVDVANPIEMPRGADRVVVRQNLSEEGEGIFTAHTRIEAGSPNLSGELDGMFAARAFVHRGRRHQVRAHLAFLGFPLVGDELYGSNERLPAVLFPNGSDAAEGFLLHAESISFEHPATGAQLHLRSKCRSLEPFLEEAL